MAGISHLNINLFPMVMLLILYADNRKNAPEHRSNRLFGYVILLTLGTLVTDTVAWLLDGTPAAWMRPVLWAASFLYLLFASVNGVLWLTYVYDRIQAEGEPLWKRGRRGRLIACLAPYFLFLAVSSIRGWMFTYDGGNRYQRGCLYMLPYLLVGGLELGSACYALWKARGEPSREKRRECLYLAAFALFPMTGAMIQGFFYGWWVCWPFAALSALIVYVNIQNRQITADALTGLNNRRELDKHLQTRLGHAGGWCLIVIDVDGFKRINDTYGHMVGDEALCWTADILREAFGAAGAFLSRYGGDEFALVADCMDGREACRLVELLYAAVEKANRRENRRYSLSLSAGYALCDGGSGTAAALIAAADRRMYREKERHKRQ